jgi:hypothetical protein
MVGGCAKARAASAPDGPPLVVPAAPARVLAPVEEEPVAENPPEPETPASPPPANRPRPQAAPRRPATTPPTAADTEPKPETPPVAPPVTAETPAVNVRPAPTQGDTAAERKARDLMNRAKTDIGRVDYQKLSANGKAQYDLSKRLNEQAEQELKDRNYTFATTLAEKAATIATELLGAR